MTSIQKSDVSEMVSHFFHFFFRVLSCNKGKRGKRVSGEGRKKGM